MDLEFATLEDIWKELEKRYKHIIIGFSKDVANDQMQSGYFWHGGLIPAIGLADALRHKLLQRHLAPPEEGEDKPIND